MTSAYLMICLSFLGVQSEFNQKDNDDLLCGVYCLTVALKSLNVNKTLAEVEKLLGDPGMKGYSMQQLNDTAKSLGCSTTASSTSLDLLEWRKKNLGENFIGITLFNDNHFVLITDIKTSTVSVCDPPDNYTLDKPIFQQKWNGKVLLISTASLTAEEDVAIQKSRHEMIKTGFLMIISLIPLTLMRQIYQKWVKQ